MGVWVLSITLLLSASVISRGFTLLLDEETRISFPYSLKQCIVLNSVRMDVNREHGVHVSYIFALRSRCPEKIESSLLGLLSIFDLINQVAKPYSIVVSFCYELSDRNRSPIHSLDQQRRRTVSLVPSIVPGFPVMHKHEDNRHARTRWLGYRFCSECVVSLVKKRTPLRVVLFVEIKDLCCRRRIEKRPSQTSCPLLVEHALFVLRRHGLEKQMVLVGNESNDFPMA
jgi:hypothetical protein